jgi:protein TonB
VNEAVDRVLLEREAVDRGFGAGVGVSAGAHLLLLVFGVAIPLLFPRPPRLEVADAFAVALPPGGRGAPSTREAGPAAPAPQPPVTTPPEPARPPDPKQVVKPPKDERKGLPELESKTKKTNKKERERYVPPAVSAPDARTPNAASAGGAGTASQTPGLQFGTAGPGVPGGMDPNGDWYLAGVQRKIWMLWNQQLRGGVHPPATVSFTIQADGSVSDVQVTQSSGIPTVDMAAQRAISTAAPFAPLPRSYGTNAFTIRAIFKPEG